MKRPDPHTAYTTRLLKKALQRADSLRDHDP
jgi:hypothetical protein